MGVVGVRIIKMEANTSKILSSVVLFLLTFLFGLLPIKISNFLSKSSKISQKKSRIIVSCLLCYGGGILLGTCFIHILPETRELIHPAGAEDSNIPIVEVCVVGGLLLIFLIEELTCWFINFIRKNKETINSEDSNSTAYCSEYSVDGSGVAGNFKRLASGRYSQKRNAFRPQSQNNVKYESKQEIEPEFYYQQDKIDGKGSTEEICRKEHNDSLILSFSKKGSIKESIKDLFLILALSSHAIFEGLAIGLEESPSDVWLLSLGISLHKLILAFSVGLEMSLVNLNRVIHFIYMLVFAMMTPIGTAIGMSVTEILTSEHPQQAEILGILHALAAGTLLYVIFFELLEKERHKESPGLVCLLTIVLGKLSLKFR